MCNTFQTFDFYNFIIKDRDYSVNNQLNTSLVIQQLRRYEIGIKLEIL